MRKVGLPRDGAERGEFGRGKAHEIQLAGARIGYIVEQCRLGRGRQFTRLAEMFGLKRRMAGITHGFRLVPSAANVIAKMIDGHRGGFSANSLAPAQLRQFGIADEE